MGEGVASMAWGSCSSRERRSAASAATEIYALASTSMALALISLFQPSSRAMILGLNIVEASARRFCFVSGHPRGSLRLGALGRRLLAARALRRRAASRALWADRARADCASRGGVWRASCWSKEALKPKIDSRVF